MFIQSDGIGTKVQVSPGIMRRYNKVLHEDSEAIATS